MGWIESEKVSLTVPGSATSVSGTTTKNFNGKVMKVEIDPGAAMAENATLKGSCRSNTLGTPDYFLDFTFPASEVERIIYPRVLTVLNTGAETTATYDGTRVVKNYDYYVVNGQLTFTLASAVAGDSTAVTVYVEG